MPHFLSVQHFFLVKEPQSPLNEDVIKASIKSLNINSRNWVGKVSIKFFVIQMVLLKENAYQKKIFEGNVHSKLKSA